MANVRDDLGMTRPPTTLPTVNLRERKYLGQHLQKVYAPLTEAALPDPLAERLAALLKRLEGADEATPEPAPAA